LTQGRHYLLEVFIMNDVLRSLHKLEAWMVTATARRKRLAINTSHLMRLRVPGIVDNAVNAGGFTGVTGLVDGVHGSSHSQFFLAALPTIRKNRALTTDRAKGHYVPLNALPSAPGRVSRVQTKRGPLVSQTGGLLCCTVQTANIVPKSLKSQDLDSKTAANTIP
jgi:hypothetical protein